MSIFIGIILISVAVGLVIGHTIGYEHGYRDADIDQALNDEHGDVLGIGSGTLPADLIELPGAYLHDGRSPKGAA